MGEGISKNGATLLVVGGVVGAPVTYVAQRAIATWGILDPISDWLGKWLKLNVSAEAVGWSMALIVVYGLYGLILRSIWRARHTHHSPVAAHAATPLSFRTPMIEELKRAFAGMVPATQPRKQAVDHQRKAMEPQDAPRPHRLTATDRERIAEVIRDVFDFLGRDLQPFHNKLVSAICGHSPPAISALEPLQAKQRELALSALELYQRHSHYLDLIGVDIIPVYRGISDLQTPMADAVEAKDWPTKAQQERANAVNTAFSELGGYMTDVQDALVAKRKEYIDV